MKVLLLKDVVGIGNKGQIKDVKQGYALNHMIPRKLAVPADTMTVKNFNTAVQAKKDKEAIHEELIKKSLLEIKGKTVLVKAKASEKGKLFKSIHEEEVAKAFELEHQIKIDGSWLPKNFSIKEVGESTVSIEKFGLKIDFVLKVEAE
jgi:large subunit ribosomal protein L9